MRRPGSSGSSTVQTIRETIAHFFGADTPARLDTPVDEHTLRDIGVNRTIYDNM